MGVEWIVMPLASALAGFVDAIVGGGGLILLPALFATFAHIQPATLFGTNKGAAMFGTAVAAYQYSQRVRVDWLALWPAVLTALTGSFVGAWLVTMVDPSFLRRLLPFILLTVLIYTLLKKDMGREHAPRFSGVLQQIVAAAVGLSIGLYDGFFGPGTGSFFIFLFVRLLGYDFLNASAAAKILNVATNIAAITLFSMKGHIWWHFAIPLAVANMLGAILGTWLALRRGVGFVRGIFIVVVSVLILKTAWDAFGADIQALFA